MKKFANRATLEGLHGTRATDGDTSPLLREAILGLAIGALYLIVAAAVVVAAAAASTLSGDPVVSVVAMTATIALGVAPLTGAASLMDRLEQ